MCENPECMNPECDCNPCECTEADPCSHCISAPE
jgi:hypothetical protein